MVIGISLDRGGKEDVAQFAKQNRITYDLAQEVNNAIPKNFGGISSIPTMIILSQEVEIVFKAGGAMPKLPSP